MMDCEDLICEYDCCKLILENPVTLVCGNNLCKEHLDKFSDKFICYICKEEHLIPANGFVINNTMAKMVNKYINFNPLRKKIKESYDELSDSIENYEKVDPDSYVFDYFSEIRNKVDLHREELKKEIDHISDQIIQDLKEREKKCKSNLAKIEKINLDELKNVNLPNWKQILRNPNINKVELSELSFNLSENLIRNFK